MKNSLPAANRSTVRPHLNTPCRKTGTAARAGRALPRVPLMATAAPEKHTRAAESCAVAPVPTPMSGRALPRLPLMAATAAPEKHPRAAAPCAVVPVPTPMHTPPEATAPGLPPATLAAAVRNGVVLRSAADRTALFAHWLAPHLPMVHGIVRRHSYFASECADNYQSVVLHLLEHLDALAHFALRCARRPHGVATPAASAVADTEHCDTPPPSCTPQADSLPELPPLADASADDVNATLPPFATHTEHCSTPAPEIAAALRPVVVTADAVMHTTRAIDPRPWLAGVTLRLLSTLNGRALRHRATHLTPASSASDEPFDPADPDGDLWSGGADPATAGAQRQAAPSRWEETLGAGRERTGGSAGVTTRDAAPARTAQAASAHVPAERAPSPTAASAAPSAGAEEATTAGGGPTAAGEGAGRAVDNCLECWHREQPRRGFHRTRGGRLWNAMRARSQQAHSAFAYRAVLRADAAAALAAQPLRDRALVLLTADGWTAEEIGLAVGASPTAVRQTVCRVRTRLRRWRKAWARRTHATRAL